MNVYVEEMMLCVEIGGDMMLQEVGWFLELVLWEEILSSTDLGMKKPYSFVRIVPSAGLTSDALQRLEFS